MPLDPSRTVEELRELQRETGDENGAQRVAWTDTWVEARKWLAQKLDGVPVEVTTDAAGNQWFTLKGESDRALLIGALTDGETRVSHWGRSRDTESTLGVVRALGVQVDEEDIDTLVVHGVGLRGRRVQLGAHDAASAGALKAGAAPSPEVPFVAA